MALPPSVQRHESNLQKCLPKFEPVLRGTGLSPEKLKQTIVNSLMANNYLASCTPESVMQAAMTAAVLGLEVDNVTGQGYLTPFKGKAIFVPGYKGYITLARNSGFVVEGDVVRERDEFRYQRGLSPVLDHIPGPGSPTERGAITHAYAVAHHSTMPSIFEVVHVEDINKIRDNSEAYKAHIAGKIKTTPWASNYDKMCKKTAIRALASRLPLNVQKAHAVESAHEIGNTAYLDDQGDLTVIDQSEASSQPGLKEITACRLCGGTKEYKSAGMTGPCPQCIN